MSSIEKGLGDSLSQPEPKPSSETLHDGHQVVNDKPEVPEVEYPEGLRAWGVAIGVFLFHFVTFGYTNSHGVFTDYYVRTYLSNYSSSAVSWIGSTQLMVTLSAGLLTGRAFDAGYFKALIISGSFVFLFCLFMVSITQPQQYYQVFLSHGLGVGLGVGLVYIPTLGAVSQHFQRSRTIAMGVASSGSAMGGLVHPILLNKLIHGPLGFHTAVRISAAMNGGLLLIAYMLTSTRFPPSNKKANVLLHLKAFSKEPEYVLTMLGTFFELCGLYFPIFFLQLNNIKNGISPTLSFYTLSILNGCSAIGRVVPNMLAQRIGVYNVIVPCTMACALMIFVIQAIKDAGGTIAFAIIFGFLSGAYIGLLAPMLTSLAKDNSEVGARMGICLSFTGLAGLIGTPIAGALLGPDYHWIRPILFGGLCVTTGSALLFAARFFVAKRKRSWKV